MSDDSSYSSLSSNRIIGYKERQRFTPIDYRELFALKADQIGELRKLSRDIDDSAEFNKVLIALLNILTYQKNKRRNDDSSSMSMESSKSSDSSTDSSISSDDSTSSSNSDSSDSDDISSISGMSTLNSSFLDDEVEDHGIRDL